MPEIESQVLGLDHVQVAAPRTADAEQKARAFYGGLLGLEEIDKPDILKPKGGAWFRLGQGDLHVGLENDFRPTRKAHPAFVVRGLDALRARLEAEGVPTVGAEPIPGIERFYVSDPFGNRIELMERVAGGEPPEQPHDKREGERLGWHLVGTTYPYRSKGITLRQDRVVIDGEREIRYTYIDSPGAVGVVPVTPDGRIILIRQYRYTVDEWAYEVPAGGLHDADGASKEEVARQELEQEVGGTCQSLESMGHFYSAIGNQSQAFHVYLALGVQLSGHTDREAIELIDIHPVLAAEAFAMARSGRIRDGVSAVSLLFCENRLRELGYLDRQR